MLQTVEEDDCCALALGKAIATGRLDEESTWTHKRCGVEWRAEIVGEVKHWKPIILIEVWK